MTLDLQFTSVQALRATLVVWPQTKQLIAVAEGPLNTR
jgi:hypothetical protein